MLSLKSKYLKIHRHSERSERISSFLSGTKLLLFIVGVSIHCLSFSQKSDSSLFVALRNGKVIYAESLDYKSKTFGQNQLIVNDETKYPLSDVKFYQDETGYHMRGSTGGFGGDEWFKREIAGEVSTFTTFQSFHTPGMWNNGMYMGGGYSTSKLTYYQKGGGLLKKVSYNNLVMDLKDNEASMLKLAEVKKLRNAATLTYVAAGAMLIGGLIHTAGMNKQEGPPPYDVSLKISPMVFVGAIGFSIPFFMKSSREEKLIKAIKLYNIN